MERACLLLVVSIACNRPDAVVVIDASAPVPVATTTATASASPAPSTDYTSLKAAFEDGDKATGKTVMTSTTRETLRAGDVVLSPCSGNEGPSVSSLFATYAPEQRAVVRGIAATVKGPCSRVVLRLAPPKEQLGRRVVELLEVVDGTPVRPSPPPTGIDYVGIDDVTIAGDGGSGKIARLDVRRQANHSSSSPFVALPCDVFGTAVDVDFRPSQAARVAAISDRPGTCTSITVKLKRNLNRQQAIWSADLVE